MKETCELCGGAGQLCYFQGHSRFLLSRRECPVCCGTGFVETTTDDPPPPEESAAGDESPSEQRGA